MAGQLDALVESLLYEGYALYPYTPGATKNATPTPFGIVYPPVYAAGSAATHDELQVECLLHGTPRRLEAAVLFLQPTGERHQGVERRLTLAGPGTQELDEGGTRARVTLEVGDGDPALVRVRVENRTEVPEGLSRTEALRRSLLSTHVIVHAPGARFESPLEAAGCDNVNTWPVLATQADDTVLAAAIFLPDHPQLAPESLGNLFDGTEIEEALLLHVHALSDGELEEIGAQDETVRSMIDRARASGPEELMRLHGILRPSEDLPDPRRGEPEVTVDGVTYRPGDQVVLRLGGRDDVYDRMLDGRTATIERIYMAYDGRAHLGVTVDSDPMRDVLRESGRYLFFFPGEVERIVSSVTDVEDAPEVTTTEGGVTMSEEHQHQAPVEEGAGERGLGSATGGLDGPGGPRDATERMPESRGEVRYADAEEQQSQRPSVVPQEGHVEEDPKRVSDASSGAKD